MSSSTETWESHKQKGNDEYKAGRVKEAIAAYSAALRAEGLPPADRATILCNRAQCFLKLEDNNAAVEDCTACLTYQPDNMKALFRRAAALEALNQKKDALADYKAMLALKAGQSDALAGVRRCEEALRGGRGGGGPKLSEEDARMLQEVQVRHAEVRKNRVRASEQLRVAMTEKKRAELTLSQVRELTDATPMYKSVGKMFMRTEKPALVDSLTAAAAYADKKLGVCDKTHSHLQRQEAEAEGSVVELVKTLQKKISA